MATIGEMIVKLLADTGNFNASMDEAAAKVTASNDAMAASMAKSMQSFRDFDNITKQSVQSTEGLASAQAALQAVQQTGAFTSEELAAKQALVDAAMLKVGKETQAASGALSMFTRNSRTMYSTSALITDAMTGQFSRMRREVAALGNETGLMARAFQFALSPAGLVAGALAAVGVAALQAEEDIARLRQAVAGGGGMAGMDAEQLENMAQGFKKMGFDVHDAREAIEALAQSGTVTRSAMQDATLAVMETAQVTGQQAEDVAKEISRSMAAGENGIIKLDEKYKFLNDSQLKNIQHLYASGQAAEAQKQAFGDLASAMGAVIKDHGGTMDSFWQRFGTTVANSWDTIANGVNKDTQQQIDKLNEQIKYYERIGVSQETINKLIKQRNDLEAQAAANAAAAAQRGNVAEARYNRDQQAMHHHAGGSAGSKLEAEFQKEEADRRRTYDQELQDGLIYWGNILHNTKSTEDEKVAAWKHTQELQKQLDAQQAAASNRAAHARSEAERKAAAEIAKYNRDAYAEVREEMRKAAEENAADVRERIASAEQVASAAVEAAQQEYDQVADKLRSRLQLHEITAAQEVDGKRRAEQKKYEDDLAALENDLALVREKPEVVAKVNAEIERLGQQHKLAQQKLDEEEASAFQKTWEGRLRPVSNAFDQMINGMMQGTQTFRQAMDNMLQNIAASFIKHSIDMTVQHIADSLARTNATAAAAASQVAITKTAAAQTKAVEAQTGQSQIMSAAATGAAKAYQAVVGIPIVGPILAPVAAGVAFAGIEAFTSDLASAAGGWERVPADGMLTELHRDEMVLPASVADPVRNMARTGGNGGGTIIIQANDAASFQDMARRNRGALVGVMREAYRRGHFG